MIGYCSTHDRFKSHYFKATSFGPPDYLGLLLFGECLFLGVIGGVILPHPRLARPDNSRHSRSSPSQIHDSALDSPTLLRKLSKLELRFPRNLPSQEWRNWQTRRT